MMPHPQGEGNVRPEESTGGSKLASGSRGTKGRALLTDDEADLAMGVLVATGHHGPHRVIDNGNHIQLHCLHKKRMPLVAGQRGCHSNQHQTQRSLLQRAPQQADETPRSLQGLLHQSSPGDRLLTCRRLMASRSRHTTSWPSQSDALKPFVQFRRMPWDGTKGRQEAGGPLESHFASPKPVSHQNTVYRIPSPVGGCPTLPIWLRALPSAPSQLSSVKKPINNHPTYTFYF